jgi:hypothetical protein
VYNLLANNVPCTISTDNGTLFRYVHIPPPDLMLATCLPKHSLRTDLVSLTTSTRS